MDSGAVPSGTAPGQDEEAIVAAELQKLQDYRSTVAEENHKYIAEHPELRTLIDDFISAAISHKPADLVKFGAFYFSDLKKNGKIGPYPVVIAGPSGVGKGTLINKLISQFPNSFGFSVSHTTRPPREGEENGVHYNFVSKAAFEEAVEKGDFIEYAKVHTNYYGTSKLAVEKVRALGKVCILDIDIQGVQSVKRSTMDCKYLFIEPPSMLELESRLRGRGTETAEKIKIRLENARDELEYGKEEGNFDCVVTNDDVAICFVKIVDALQDWYPDQDLYLGK
ncbi:guanylate kinase [Ochromonadaceae sp. CCMP2298]|nr:guanylate kinase [Ochromonadaceae sp. CCMP2298]|mmetsp:Transcript_30255/g.66965  ORF Transcript_30255/g.66965 Transcript_30255/m.66965 type:complete len:281 (-) Transcript_30255:35-877(-)